LVTDLPADFDVALQGVDTRLKALQPGTTLGDLSYSSATANTNTRLGIGTTGQVLTVAGGVPTWAAAGAVSGCAVFNNGSSFSYTNGTTTILPFNGELFDTHSYHDNSTNNSRITIPTGKAGVYLIDTNVRLRDATGTYAFISIFKNGSRVQQEGIENGDINRESMQGGYRWITGTSIYLTLAENDYIEIATTSDSATQSYTLQAQFSATLVI
jgi:hypothetical protein